MTDEKLCSAGHVIGASARDGKCERCGGAAVNDTPTPATDEEVKTDDVENTESGTSTDDTTADDTKTEDAPTDDEEKNDDVPSGEEAPKKGK